MKTNRLLFALALLLTIGTQAEAKKVKLQYQLKAGDEFKYEISMKQETAQEVMGQSQSSTTDIATTYHFKVTGVSATGDMLMQAALVGYAMSTTSPAGEMKYDSAKDTVVPAFANLSTASINQFYSFTLSPLGKISDIKAPEGLVEKINKIVAEMGDGQMGMGDMAGDAAGPEGFRKTLEGFLITFPEGGAEAKKPWETESKINQMVSLKVLAKYELVKATKETNEIKLSGTISQDADAPPMEIQGMNMTFQLLGAKDGKMMLDAVTGLVQSVDAVTSISGNISIDSPQLPSPMSIPMTLRMTEKMTRK